MTTRGASPSPAALEGSPAPRAAAVQPSGSAQSVGSASSAAAVATPATPVAHAQLALGHAAAAAASPAIDSPHPAIAEPGAASLARNILTSLFGDQAKRSQDVSEWLPDDVPPSDAAPDALAEPLPSPSDSARTSSPQLRLGQVDELGFFKSEPELFDMLDILEEKMDPHAQPLSKQERNEQKARDFARELIRTVVQQVAGSAGGAGAAPAAAVPRPAPGLAVTPNARAW